MFDKRYKCFCAGMIVGAVTWSVSLYLYWVLSSSNIVQETGKLSSLKYHNDVVLPYEEGMSLSKGKDRYLPHSSNSLDQGDIFRQKLKAVWSKGGENEPGRVKSLADLKFRDEGYNHHGFNALVSRNLDYHRSIPDTRNELCRNQTYPTPLPTVSVIICYYNEQFDTLIRSLHSILNRTPASILKEMIIVDDYSDIKGLDESVTHYIKSTNLVKVKKYKTNRREGLIRARVYGAERASGDVLVFLDSHVEANIQWLEPLLTRIQEDDTRVVTPIIDIINSDTFEYKSSPIVRGGFNWGLHFKWINVPNSSLQKGEDFVKPITSPAMAGGLFAMSRKYFEHLGQYDTGMNIWGGENIEISLRIWMCGGSIEIVPCSRIGHVFRKHRPYGSPEGEDTMLRNSLRAANVWMDEYKDRFYQQRPEAAKINYGDIRSRLQLRKNLKCKSFDWYVKNVYPDLLEPGNGDNLNGGNPVKKLQGGTYGRSYQIRLSGTSLCIASEKDFKTRGSELVLKSCLRVKNQLWYETNLGELKLAQYLCMDAVQDHPVIGKCHQLGGSQEWRHKAANNMAVYNAAAGTCLFTTEIAPNSKISLSICAASNRSQWDFVPVDW